MSCEPLRPLWTYRCAIGRRPDALEGLISLDMIGKKLQIIPGNFDAAVGGRRKKV
jgi:hypothetical protein